MEKRTSSRGIIIEGDFIYTLFVDILSKEMIIKAYKEDYL